MCGETISDIDMMENAFSTFHALICYYNTISRKRFKKYSELNFHLVVDEQNDLLMKNYENLLTGSTTLSEVNEGYSYHSRRGKCHGSGCGPGCGRDNGQEQNLFPSVNHSPKEKSPLKGCY